METVLVTADRARRRRRRAVAGLIGISLIGIGGLWIWMAIGGSGLWVTLPAGPLPAGRLLIGIQTSPMHLSGPGRMEPGEGGLWAVDSESGSNRRRIGGMVEHARVSPDGRFIAYLDDLNRLWIGPVDGRSRKLVPDVAGVPCWAPDGRSIAVSSYDRTPSWGLKFAGHFRVDASTLEAEPIPLPVSDQIGDWAPDGRSLLVTAAQPNTVSRIAVRPLDGGEARPISAGFHDGSPRVSPDGRRVAYLRYNHAPRTIDLCAVALDGTDFRVLREAIDGEPQSLCWSPDGSAILVKGHQSLAVVRGDGSLAPIGLSVRKPFDLFDPRASFDGTPLYIGSAEWVDEP